MPGPQGQKIGAFVTSGFGEGTECTPCSSHSTINVSRMILGEPELAFAAGRVGDLGVDDQVGAILRFAGGRVALIDCGLVLPRREEYEVVGTAARLQVPNAFLPGTADAPINITRGTESTTETVAGVDQSQRHVTADIAGAAGNQDAHFLILQRSRVAT